MQNDIFILKADTVCNVKKGCFYKPTEHLPLGFTVITPLYCPAPSGRRANLVTVAGERGSGAFGMWRVNIGLAFAKYLETQLQMLVFLSVCWIINR